MKTKYEILNIKGKNILVSGVETIKAGDKFVNINNGIISKVETLDGMIGFTGHMGHSFLCFREKSHRKFIKEITQRDLSRMAPKRKYKPKKVLVFLRWMILILD